MKIPVSGGTQVSAQPIMQQHTPMTGLSEIGRTVDAIQNQRDEKQRQEEAQQKAIALYHDQIAAQEGQLKVDDVLTTEMTEQVTLLKNDVANGAVSADDANKKLNEWSDQRYKQLEPDLPLHAREQYQNYWKQNIQQQSSSMLPLQLRADAQKGLTLVEQAFSIATRYDEAKGAEYLDLHLDKANFHESTKSEIRYKYKQTRNMMSIDERMTNAMDSKDITDLDQLLAEIKQGGFGYLDGPTLQRKTGEILSRKNAINTYLETQENKRVQLAGKALNDFKSQVFTSYALSDDLINKVRDDVKGTEHEQEFEFYVHHSGKIQTFKDMKTSDQQRFINQQHEILAKGEHADPKTATELLKIYESVHQDKLNTVKENPSQAVREAGLNIHPLPAGEMHMNPKSWAAKAVENGVSQASLKDSNVKLLPIPAEDLPDAKKAFNEAGVQGKLAIISNLIGESKGVKNGSAIWGSALGQLGGDDRTYLLAGLAKSKNRVINNEYLADALIQGEFLVKKGGFVLPTDLETKFRARYGNLNAYGNYADDLKKFQLTYATLADKNGKKHDKKDEIADTTIMNKAFDLATGGVYKQEPNSWFGSFKTDTGGSLTSWNVPKPYGMSDDKFEAYLELGYSALSKQSGYNVSDLKNFRLVPRITNETTSIMYGLIDERGRKLLGKNGKEQFIIFNGVNR